MGEKEAHSIHDFLGTGTDSAQQSTAEGAPPKAVGQMPGGSRGPVGMAKPADPN